MRTANPSFDVTFNPVLRDTYLLLSTTLLFGAVTAWFGATVRFNLAMLLGFIALEFFALYTTLKLRDEPSGLASLFVFVGLNGFTMGPMLAHYAKLPGGPMLIAVAAGMAGAIFAGLSLYVLITRKNFSYLGGALSAALWGLIIAGVLNWWLRIGALELLLAYAGVIVFCGYVLYDTSELIHDNDANCIVATVELYLDVVCLFTKLLKILAALASSDDD